MWHSTLGILFVCFGIILGVVVADSINPHFYPAKLNPLTVTADTQPLLNAEMEHLLEVVPGADQARLAFIHEADSEGSRLERYRFDVVAHAAAPGHTLGKLYVELPLSEWHDFLPSLVANRCPIVQVSDIAEDSLLSLLDQPDKATKLMGCPLMARNGDLQGAVLLLWSHPPQQKDIDTAYDALRDSAIQVQKIASAPYSLR